MFSATKFKHQKNHKIIVYIKILNCLAKHFSKQLAKALNNYPAKKEIIFPTLFCKMSF
jgi:hypothetical protein